MSEPGGRRIQLVAAPEPSRREALLTGAGLLSGLFLGRASLMGAITGAERIEAALAHFVLVVLVCVGALLALGRLVDHLTERAETAERRAALDGKGHETDVGDATLASSDEIG